MINIIDTFRNVVGDKFAMIKVSILALPMVFLLYMHLSENVVQASVIELIFLILLLAVFFETIKRSCNNEPMLIPSFLNPLPMFITLGISILVGIPALIVLISLYFMLNYVVQQNPQILSTPVSIYILGGLIWIVAMSIYFASVTQYLDSGKPKDALNVIKVVKALKTFFLDLFFYLIQAFLLNLVIGAIPIAIIIILSGADNQNFILLFYYSILSVLNWLILADYLAQTKKDSDCY